MKLQAVDLNSDIKRNYEALGRAVYESRKQGIDSTEEIDDIIILINEKYDELDEVNEQLSKMSNKTFCTRCGEPNPKTAGFCSQCGEKLVHEVPQDDAYAAQGGCSCGCHAETEPQQQEQAQQEQPAQEQTEKQNRIHKHNWIPIHVKRGEYPLFFILFSRVTMAKIGCLWHKRDNAII